MLDLTRLSSLVNTDSLILGRRRPVEASRRGAAPSRPRAITYLHVARSRRHRFHEREAEKMTAGERASDQHTGRFPNLRGAKSGREHDLC
jgi:hypothetical protein